MEIRERPREIRERPIVTTLDGVGDGLGEDREVHMLPVSHRHRLIVHRLSVH